MKLDRILVATDGSANGRAAVLWATGMARLVGAEVVAVHAVGLLDRLDDSGLVASYPHRDEIRVAFESIWCRPLTDAGVVHRAILRDGNPVDVVLAVAREETPDLIVLGSRGAGEHPELTLGSTSAELVHSSPRPVVVVPLADSRDRS